MRPKKRSVTILGHRTSISLEDEMWDEFQYIADSLNRSVDRLAAEIDAERSDSGRGLSSAIRIFIVNYWKDRAAQPISPSTGTVSSSQ